MLVEINLLPKREQKSRLIPLLSIVFAVLLIVGAATFYVIVQRMEQQIAQLKRSSIKRKRYESQKKKNKNSCEHICRSPVARSDSMGGAISDSYGRAFT